MGFFKSAIFSLLILTFSTIIFTANASDPDILSDFLVPPNIAPAMITRQYFTFTGFRNLNKVNFTGKTAIITKATKKEFPALDGQAISVASILYPPSGINPPHIHPRASELLMVLDGVLEVGLVDSNNKLYVQTLRAPDMFIFPKGLVHYQINTRSDKSATALGMFGGASAGTVSLPKTIFGSGISEQILANAFKTDEDTITSLIKSNK